MMAGEQMKSFHSGISSVFSLSLCSFLLDSTICRTLVFLDFLNEIVEINVIFFEL